MAGKESTTVASLIFTFPPESSRQIYQTDSETVLVSNP